MKVPKLIALTAFMCILLNAKAQEPVVKIDFNQSGRQESEVNDPDYIFWNDYTAPVSQTYEGVTFSLQHQGSYGVGLKSNWYKTGIQAGNKLVGDGVRVDPGEGDNPDLGNAGAEILLTLSGLPNGTHSLLAFFNQTDAPSAATYCPIDVYVNDQLVVDNVVQTVRAASMYESAAAYFTFEVTQMADVKILFKADVTGSSATSLNVMINAIELNTPNFWKVASVPSPAHRDEHFDFNNGNVNLSWTAATNATSHDVYVATSLDEINQAGHGSSAFKGNQSGTTYALSGLNKHDYYYWRIDEVLNDGTTEKGTVWYFRLRQLAFPGAEGYGKYARGARGGKVVHVTNLNDSGEGSFRDAITNQTGARYIVFDVSGIIQLQSRLVLNSSYVTIAGQTAPGKGITLRDAPFGLSGAHDAIVQNLRVRRGDVGEQQWGGDGMGMSGCNNSIIDHCSISWTIDEAFSSRNGKNISLQRTLISEALNIAEHPNYPTGTKHGYAASIGGDIGSFHLNLLAHNEGRNWSLAGGLDGSGVYSGRLDITNNVVYNWGGRTTDGGAHEVNFVGNYYKPGPASTNFYALTVEHEGAGTGTQAAYFAGNVMPGKFDLTNQEAGRRYRISGNAIVDWETFVSEPFFESLVKERTAVQAYKEVLSDVGCISPVLDDHDIRMITETLNGTYTYKGSKSGVSGLPDSQNDVGGWEEYPEEQRDASWDSDRDGLPDWWENYYGLNASSPEGDYSDTNVDAEGDGYVEMDRYLQWMSKPHYFQKVDAPVVINLPDLFRGYTDGAFYEVGETMNGYVDIDDVTATCTPDSCGMASFKFKVTDADEDSMEREVVAFFSPDDQGNCKVVTAAIDTKSQVDLFVTPNPVSGDELYLKGLVADETLKACSILDMQGKLIQTINLNESIDGGFQQLINLPGLRPGIYLLKVELANTVQVLRFVKK